MTRTTSVAAAPPNPSGAAAEVVFRIRAMRPSDLAFVTDSWLRSAWDQENRRLRVTHNRREREKAGKAWWPAARPKVEALIADEATAVIIACDRTDPDHIAGWLAIREGVELRSHVKHAYRPWGVGDLLRRAADQLNAKEGT